MKSPHATTETWCNHISKHFKMKQDNPWSQTHSQRSWMCFQSRTRHPGLFTPCRVGLQSKAALNPPERSLTSVGELKPSCLSPCPSCLGKPHRPESLDWVCLTESFLSEGKLLWMSHGLDLVQKLGGCHLPIMMYYRDYTVFVLH